jgi:hypothetical protein
MIAIPPLDPASDADVALAPGPDDFVVLSKEL